jgi:hypothetical protein
MKFIELHNGTGARWVKIDAIKMIEEAEPSKTRPEISSYIRLDGSAYFFNETPEEILKKIAEAEHESSFMDEWKREVDDQMKRLTVRKDGEKDATDRW